MKFVAKELKHTADASSGREAWHEKLKNVAIVVVAISGLYLILILIADYAARHINEDVEAKVFSSLPFSIPTNSPPEFARAEAIFKQLVDKGDLRPLPYRIRYLDMEAPNAFAAPGGWVVVTRGLLEQTTNETALAFVLGHELGHHQYRHTMKGLGRGALLALVFGLVFGSAESGVVSKAVNFAEQVHSRSNENEADDFGFRLAYTIYGDATGYLEFFEMLIEKYEVGMPQWMAFASSHPPSRERLEQLRTLQNELAEQDP